mmetsp:Transcript_8202/g.19602  ORF Transcript_8202/g.19602 Transcript_8202/m.19602 type:complete len:581 (+) Transcript_8202:74-1816(+)
MTSHWLLDQLCTEYREHVAQQDKETQELTENRRRYPRQDATAHLLLKVADKLLQERAGLEEARFEEHTADLIALCRRFGLNFEKPKVSEKALTGFFSSLRIFRQPAGAQNSARRSSLRPLFGSCMAGGAGFPQNRKWWPDVRSFFERGFEVLRNADFVHANAPEMVVGDIVYLKSGDCAPCDLRVLKALEDTRIDTSTGVGSEVRDCTELCTSADPLSSDNIVLKGSWILQGSLLAVVIRTSMDPLAPHRCANNSDQDVEFAIDATVPSGLAAASCQTIFSSLWTKANCICRSFEVMVQLSAVDAVIIFLTEDLRKDSSALQDTVRDLHGLGKAVFLLVKDQGSASRLAEDLKLKPISFEKGKQTPSTCVSSIGSSFDMSFEGDVMATCSGTTPRQGQEEERIADLMNSCKAAAPGAVVHGMSEAALVQFCLVMQEAGLSPMYVASHLQSQFLRSLSDPTFRSQAPSVSSATQVQHFPSRASQDASASASPRRAKAIVKTRTEEVDHGEAHNLTNVIKHMGFAELSKVGEKVTPKRASSVTIVSLNATGVLADRCSCACLRSDLRCVGQALQLAARVSKI